MKNDDNQGHVFCAKCGKDEKTSKLLSTLKNNNVLRCKEDIRQDEIFEEQAKMNRKQWKEKANKPTDKANTIIEQLEVPERHSILKHDPKSGLGYLRPKNEQAEKEKFKHYWEARNNDKGKIYNPRFNY